MLDILHNYWSLLLWGRYPQGPIGGLALTLFLAVVGLVCAFPLAVLVGVARTCPIKPIRLAASLYVHTVRGLPVLILLFWSYYAVPLISGQFVSGVTTLIVALVAYEMAFLGEVFRAGIEAIPKGQVEAARTLGLSYSRCLLDVVLPQAIFNMIPSILSQLINLIKNTSLGYVIAVAELTYSATQINIIELTKPLETFGTLAFIYFVVCFSLTRSVGWVERRIERKRHMSPS